MTTTPSRTGTVPVHGVDSMSFTTNDAAHDQLSPTLRSASEGTASVALLAEALVHLGLDGDAVDVDGLSPWTASGWGH